MRCYASPKGSGAIKWGKRQAIAPLSPQGRSALHLVGGLCKLGVPAQDDLRWLKKEFVSVWKSTPVNVKSLPQSNTPEYEQPKVARW